MWGIIGESYGPASRDAPRTGHGPCLIRLIARDSSPGPGFGLGFGGSGSIVGIRLRPCLHLQHFSNLNFVKFKCDVTRRVHPPPFYVSNVWLVLMYQAGSHNSELVMAMIVNASSGDISTLGYSSSIWK